MQTQLSAIAKLGTKWNSLWKRKQAMIIQLVCLFDNVFDRVLDRVFYSLLDMLLDMVLGSV